MPDAFLHVYGALQAALEALVDTCGRSKVRPATAFVIGGRALILATFLPPIYHSYKFKVVLSYTSQFVSSITIKTIYGYYVLIMLHAQ